MFCCKKFHSIIQSYPPSVLVDLVARILALVPPWTRVYRVQVRNVVQAHHVGFGVVVVKQSMRKFNYSYHKEEGHIGKIFFHG